MASLNHVHSPNSCAARWCGATPNPVLDAVADADWLVSELLDALDAAGATDKTLVILTSDNGAPLSNDQRGNHPLRGGKAQVWEGGFREPGIVRWPGVVAPRTTTRAIAATIDVHVTLLRLAGLEAFAPDGRDLTPILRGDANETGHACYPFWNVPDPLLGNNPDGLAAVRCGDHKAYWWTNDNGTLDSPLVFDLVEDPSEASPLDNTTKAFADALEAAADFRQTHLASIELVPNQMAMGSDRSHAICGAPGATPVNCTLNPENWAPPSVCGDERCVATGTFQCLSPSEFL